MKNHNIAKKLDSKKITLIVLMSIIALTMFSLVPSAAASTSPSSCGLLPSVLAAQVQQSAPWYCPINGQIYAEWKNVLPYVLVVVLVAFLIAAIIFMSGVALRNDRLRNFGVGEIYEASASALIVVLFLYISAVAFGLIPSLVVGTINPYATAFNLMLSTINGAENVYSSIFQIYMIDSFVVSIQTSITIPGYAFQNALLGLGQTAYQLPLETFFIQPANIVGTFIIDGIAAIYAQYYLLVFFTIAAIPVFIVPGIVFRAILPTRALGGVMLAIGIAFYLVMPILFGIAYYFTSPQILSSLSSSYAQLNRWGTGTGSQSNALSADSPLALALSNVQSGLSSFWLLILFYPILIIAVTYAFINEAAQFIGGFAYGIGKMRSFV